MVMRDTRPVSARLTATRADVAKLAGVSASTVTYTLNGERPISDATRERVEAAMRELKYSPNVMAKALASNRSGLVAMLFPIRERGFNPSDFEYFRGASEVAQEAGLELLLSPMALDDRGPLDHVVSRLVEGTLVMEVQYEDPRVDFLTREQRDFVLIGRTKDPGLLDFVDADFSDWGPMAIEHLAALGHTVIGYVSQEQSLIEHGYGPLLRVETGMIEAAEKAGITLHMMHVEASVHAGRDAFSELVALDSRVTAILGFNELAVIGVLEGASALGWSVPADLSLIQFGISEQGANMTVPPQTTVSVDGHQLGARAMRYLLDRISGKADGPQQHLAQTVLTDRGSTAAPRR